MVFCTSNYVLYYTSIFGKYFIYRYILLVPVGVKSWSAVVSIKDTTKNSEAHFEEWIEKPRAGVEPALYGSAVRHVSRSVTSAVSYSGSVESSG